MKLMKLSIIYITHFLEYVQSILQRLENGGNMYALAVYFIAFIKYLLTSNPPPPPRQKK